ncbi:MAG: class I SAM-dependent methyltransferase [Pirellulales bacterium]
MNTSSPSPSEIEKIWRRYDEDELRLTAALSERMLERGDAGSKLRILDIATGRGEPAIRAAQMTQQGMVVGIDSAAAMLKMAQERASREGVTNLQLLEADAMELPPLPFHDFDLALCRWGLMYFSDPKKTLAWVRKVFSIQPGNWWRPFGRALTAFPIFTTLENYWRTTYPFHRMNMKALQRFDMPKSNAFTAISKRKDGRIDSIEEMEVDVMEARTDHELVAWVRAFGLNRLTQHLSNELQQAWERDLIEQSQNYKKGTSYYLGGVTRIVVASPG